MAKMAILSENIDSIPNLFFKGDYTSIFQTYEQDPRSISDEDLHFVIGALCMLGRTLVAEELFRSRRSHFSKNALAFSIFYLGTGVTRKSQYKKARQLFKLNQSLHGEDADPSISFYAFQGIAFYLYFKGQFFRAEKYATKSFKLAVQSGSVQLKFWAQDLLAYTLIQTGQVSRGLDLLREVHTLSEKLGNQAFATATEVSILLVEAEHGYRRDQIIKDLYSLLANLRAQNNYSKSKVVLELARQQTMRGQWLEAETLLNNQAAAIFSSENRRLEITLNLHWSKIAFLRGQYILALQYLRSAQLRLHGEADQNFALQILSLEVDILEAQQNPLLEQRRQELLKLSTAFSTNISRNRLARQNLIEAASTAGEDHIHDVLLEMQQNPERAIEIVVSSGYYTWFYKCLPLERGVNYVLLGAAKDSLFVFSNEGVHSHKISAASSKLLEILGRGPISKDDLVREMWGYEYHPLRHDNLVYTAMSTLRKSFGSKHHFIQTTEEGYSLHEDAHFMQAKRPKAKKAAITSTTLPIRNRLNESSPIDTSLNYRQLQALEYLQENRFLNTRDYRQLFQTTEITASRDLSALNKKGHVVKVGFGRSTAYTLAGGK